MVSKQKWPQKEPFCCCGASTDYQLIGVPLLLGHGCALTTCHTFRMCHAVARSAALGRPSVRGCPRPHVEVSGVQKHTCAILQRVGSAVPPRSSKTAMCLS